MRYAETGFDLEVDLTRGNIERVATDPELTDLYLGGLGTTAKIMWDRVPPEAEPFSPENTVELFHPTGYVLAIFEFLVCIYKTSRQW